MLAGLMRAALPAFAVALATQPALARDPLVQQPSTNWQIDYGEDKCTLARAFGEGDDLTYFLLSMYAPGDGPSISVRRKERTRTSQAIRAQFGPGLELNTLDMALHARFGDDFQGVLFKLGAYSLLGANRRSPQGGEAEEADATPKTDLPGEATRINDLTEFHLEGAFKDDLVLELGPMGAPMDAMNACLDELVYHWGVDAEAQKSLTRKLAPANYPGDWMKAQDYPKAMLRKGYPGVVYFRLIVDADGKPTECAVQETSQPDKFAEVTCDRMMKRAKFIPALDADGKPIPSYYNNSVSFTTGY